MLDLLGPDYKLEAQPESGAHLDLFPFGKEPYPIWLHERRDTEVGLKTGAHTYLSPFRNDSLPVQAQGRR